MLAPLLLTAILSPQGSSVFVVDAGGDPDADFTSLQDATLSAPDGATLLVRPGTYAPFTVLSKSLAIVADNGGPVTLESCSAITTPGDHVLIDGLSIEHAGLGSSGVSLLGFGTGWVEDVDVTGSVSSLGSQGVFLEGLAWTQFVGVSVPQIPAPTWGGNAGMTALFVNQAGGVAIWDSLFESQHGGFGSTASYAGAALVSDRTFISGSTFRGNDGSPEAFDSDAGNCVPPGQPGSGLELFSDTTWLVDTTAFAGAQGTLAGVPCNGAAPSAPAAIVGEFTDLPTLGARRFDLTGVVRPGDGAQMSFEGVAGESVFIGYSSTPSLVFDMPLAGAVGVGLTPTILPIGALDSAGELTAAFTSSLPPGLAQLIYVQSLFVGSSDGAVLGTPRTTLLLGSGF